MRCHPPWSQLRAKCCFFPVRKKSGGIWMCKRILKPIRSILRLLGEGDISRPIEELQAFYYCILVVDRYLRGALPRRASPEDRERWEVLWEYVSLHTMFQGRELHSLYTQSLKGCHSFEATCDGWRYNFLASRLLRACADLPRLFLAWGLHSARTLTWEPEAAALGPSAQNGCSASERARKLQRSRKGGEDLARFTSSRSKNEAGYLSA
ncbi:uncharacterized protein LOC125746363 isoform X2 [Brienomyrus brachyistius]|uniref:uncharacterized protein LOC125746363 isoform X2 n=1 Tax=Brienomyrus brachyistius TaxID=42636 RepID=UPI0020B34FEC|nr:uncharacterized protein LOC125746363 isoform X2 [Brienomyrus brachyistius]